ncbi:hypothetical protein HHK36_001056 [Tetracentron sinense]|uniref:Uncharacterized protein n=1 Tax=Tetracentron sinense TaxID=13715 RepID=A0A834ZWY8_TETSI|nr:hypothetical protein HHK36_001056 [Tetracentron sinense]
MASSSQFMPMIESSSSTSSSTPQTSTDESSSDKDQEMVSQRHNKRLQKMTNLMPPQMLVVLLQPVGRQYIKRDREGSHRQILKDYFANNCTYSVDYFHRRYQMQRELFIRILKDVEAYDEYFVQRKDCCGRLGCSSVHKITTVVRILAYGLSADHCDDYLKIGESTAIESLKCFCEVIIALYEGQYLRSPNEQDIARLLQEGEERGFVGMLGSLDYMHWELKNFSTASHGTHRGHHHKPTLILEAVASKDLWIWHAFFGMPGSHNDVNDLDHSPLFDTLIHGRMPPVNYMVNGRQHTLGYYLSDDECDIDVERWRPPPDETIFPLEYARNPAILVAHISSRLSRIRNRGTNMMLRFNLMEHLWNKFGDETV